MFWLIKYWMFCCLPVSIILADDIDEDYYFGSNLRSQYTNDCNPVKELYCNHKCKEYVGTCFKEKCYCIFELKLDSNEGLSEFQVKTNAGLIEDGKVLVYPPRLRHHIAHFCPNLDEARKCIRKCMKEGKPAFCGKDHICYCGHRYSYHQKEKKIDPAKVNAGFYELYEKYFGPDTTVMEKESRIRKPIKTHSTRGNSMF